MERFRASLRDVATTIIGTLVLGFLTGALVTEFEVFPYPQLLEAPFTALRAESRQIELNRAATPNNLWAGARFDDSGVVLHDREHAFAGYTLYTSGHASAAFLIDMEGNVVHEWRVPFEKAFPSPDHLDNVPDESTIFWRRAYLYPNGDVLAVYTGPGTPWGLGLVRVDADSNVVWRFGDHVHHEVTVAGDGTINTLTHSIRDTREAPLAFEPQVSSRWILEDFVVQLSPDGAELRRFSLLDALARSDFREVLNAREITSDKWDALHTNDVTEVTPSYAAKHTFARAGELMVSMRKLDTIGTVDPATEKFTWVMRGYWAEQHDPDLLGNGNILVFDNRGGFGPGGKSRVMEVDPATSAIRWVYRGSPQKPFFSAIRGTQQMLPNGNVLITESDGGRIFEVTRDHQIVWEFRTPARMEHDGADLVAIVSGGTRFAADELDFEFVGPLRGESSQHRAE